MQKVFKKHTECAVPAGQTFRKESYKVFSYFLYFTKSRKKPAAKRQKVLILLMRSRSCGELNRGLQNLDSPFGKGFNFVRGKLSFRWADSRFAEPRYSLQRERIVTFCVVQKVTKKHAGLRPATSIQISARFKIFAEVTSRHQVTGCVGHYKVSGYRRWGFESVRKGYRSADARLQSFGKGLLHCKLTVSFRGWNLRLHVSLGAVKKCCRGVVIKGVSFLHCLAWTEKAAFSAKQKCFHLQKTFLNAFESHLFLHAKRHPFCANLSFLSSNATLF